jgi:hypothetical protein
MSEEQIYTYWVITSDENPETGWHSIHDIRDTIKYIPPEHHVEKWQLAKPFEGGKLNEIVSREEVCPCCFYYDKPGYIWNANHWMRCPACNRTEVEKKTGLVTDSISVEAWKEAYIEAYDKKECACPFCGEQGSIEEEDEDFQDGAFYVHMHCGRCKTRWMDRYVHDSIVVKDKDNAS